MMLNPHEKVTVETNDVFLMAESRAYFEAFRHVLIELQLTEDIPFQVRFLYNICVHACWPNAEWRLTCILCQTEELYYICSTRIRFSRTKRKRMNSKTRLHQ